MNNFLRFCSIVSITIATLKIGLAGLLTSGWIIFIIVCALLILAGGKKVFKITAALAALALFARYYGGGNTQQTNAVFQGVLTLALMLFGVYIMFRGFFRERNR